MGLFSNNKKLCPLCGAPTPRLLPTKVEDMPLCKECAAKIDLPGGKPSGLVEALEVLKGVEDIGIVTLTHKDVVRHELVQAIVRAYERRQAASPRSTGERRFAPKR